MRMPVARRGTNPIRIMSFELHIIKYNATISQDLIKSKLEKKLRNFSIIYLKKSSSKLTQSLMTYNFFSNHIELMFVKL